MRKTLVPGEYTQINTVEINYMIQNVNSSYSFYAIVADTQPADNAAHDFVIKPFNGITSSHMEGLVWGKPTGKTSMTVGIVEE